MTAKKVWESIAGFFDDVAEQDEPVYAPAHLAGVLILSLLALGVLYWLLWALLVCEGGLPAKVLPFLSVVFTEKTLADYGYVGHPYALGIFEGWVVNLAALVLSAALFMGGWIFYHTKEKKP